jgi:putative sigma-54 modulation protein
MKVNVHAVNFAVDDKVGRYVQERMDKLENITTRWFLQMSI